MASRRLLLLLFLGPLLVVTACFAAARPCYTPEQAGEHAGKEICLSAHVYDVVENADGTRFLDVCKPGTPDESCRFTVVSLAVDRKEVGALDTVREQDVHLRGTVQTLRGQSIMLLSDARQFHGGPEKFRPNPELMRGFSAGSEGLAFKDPAMLGHKPRATSAFTGSATTLATGSAASH